MAAEALAVVRGNARGPGDAPGWRRAGRCHGKGPSLQARANRVLRWSRDGVPALR